MSEPEIVVVPRDLYYHEVAYVRGLEKEIERLRSIAVERMGLFGQAASKVEELEAALNYVADMTYCGTDAEWHFKPGYDPQRVLDAIAPE